MVHLIREGIEMGGQEMGLQFLFFTLILTGIIQIMAGVFKLGKFIRMIPSSVMMGFVNGLAIVIFLSQLNMFKSGGQWLEQEQMTNMIGLVLLTMAIMYFLPKLTKKIPSRVRYLIALLLKSAWYEPDRLAI